MWNSFIPWFFIYSSKYFLIEYKGKAKSEPSDYFKNSPKFLNLMRGTEAMSKNLYLRLYWHLGKLSCHWKGLLDNLLSRRETSRGERRRPPRYTAERSNTSSCWCRGNLRQVLSTRKICFCVSWICNELPTQSKWHNLSIQILILTKDHFS